ncbi:MAG: hypothetical protein GY835_08405 [bacterium]|nr:hypothetical protein [bacterium]
MFRKLEDFDKAYAGLCTGTAKIMALLTDDNLEQSVAEEFRTLSHVAWHIITTVPEMMNRVGLGLSCINFESMPPPAGADYLKAYQAVATELQAAIKANWTDETLLLEDDLYGQKWARGLTLRILIEHEVHHRGQMTVLLRQAGLQVPGLMGPSKEEWDQFGMPAPPY